MTQGFGRGNRWVGRRELRRILRLWFRRRFAFRGYTPVCFAKSVQGFKNELVAGGRKIRVCKRLKMGWLFGRVFECARALGRFRLGREKIAVLVRTDLIVRSGNVEEMIVNCGAVVKFEVFIGRDCRGCSNLWGGTVGQMAAKESPLQKIHGMNLNDMIDCDRILI